MWGPAFTYGDKMPVPTRLKASRLKMCFSVRITIGLWLGLGKGKYYVDEMSSLRHETSVCVCVHEDVALCDTEDVSEITWH